MNRDDIIAMARDANPEHDLTTMLPFLSRFAALVTAKEREACAQVCDAKAHEVRLWCNESNVVACAAAIRARKE